MISPTYDLHCPGRLEPSRIKAARRDRPEKPRKSREDAAVLAELVNQAKAGEAAAQKQLLEKYQRRITGFIRSIIRQTTAVEDLTQIVFIKMFRRLGRLRETAAFESWLFALARNTSLDFMRRRACRPHTVALETEAFQIADASAPDGTAEILSALDLALARANPIDANLMRQVVAGSSYAEIAEMTGLTVATIKVRLHRLRPFLRNFIGEMTGTRSHGRNGWTSNVSYRSSAFDGRHHLAA